MKIMTKKFPILNFTCPFCQTAIKGSSKTEICYRSNWIKGCSNCFTLSIMKETAANFQQKNFEIEV
ncbi:hypothetical protein A2966_01185 [Candidatus Roizmanbacteria bacterium RIFCSPLOWO2_01_FULL_41_22]|uniref:Uncharacterized protein n=2 Tax=Candidatus Roizmaniibacteriota TaxID=1752723 RepID=A0A1F7JRE5_9BACT|nr:MAG: hypothetical protein A2966_01185 [Candidatus Roizmanbacteria bacterium RIFCSPLOWO2_01_FULL_41_22]OGK58172.1 MAG: hypothetical protein A3H86_02100 [Candidatus Roizmanbacteria bacterium RIFCSPLOWO2_02_FULL_41_9]